MKLQLLAFVIASAASGAAVEGQKYLSLQEKQSACSAPKDKALLNIEGTMNGDKLPLPTIRISLYENCMDALEVNQTNILQYIRNLNKSFKQYDSFYDIAKDPPASDPNSHGADLGNSIYGEGEGQVNLEKRLADVITDIETNGATASTFWDTMSPFSLFRDGHVKVPEFSSYSPIGGNLLTVYPERALNGGNVKARPDFSYDEEGKFQFKIHWKNELDNSIDESIVDSIDGKDAYSYFLEMANKEISNNWQTIGARMNMLLTYMLRITSGLMGSEPQSLDYGEYQPYLFRYSHSSPIHPLPG